MRIPLWLVLIGALIATAVMLLIGTTLIDPNTALIQSAGFEFQTLTPNADGDSDVVPFSYVLSRPAKVSVYLENAAGERFNFRDQQDRPAGEFSVLFSGVVDGDLPTGEIGETVVERRLIPDGDYTWTLLADGTQRDEQMTVTGMLSVMNGDPVLPMITSFSLTTPIFTPNQDGVTDRVGISAVIAKDAQVSAYLLDDNQRYVIAEREGIRPVDDSDKNQGFRYEFDYEGGVDINADPPPDGTYTIVVEAQDFVGQRVIRTAELTIAKGGKPYAEIVGQPIGPDVVFAVHPYEDRFTSSAEKLGDFVQPPADGEDNNLGEIIVPVGDMLVFKLVVENYGASPIRTSGPPPGTVYQQTQLYTTLGEGAFAQAGVWRVGLQCETATEPYPWRWALGDTSTLESEYDPATGNTYLYLPPGERVIVWGAVRLTEYVPTFNPQTCYAGLIHEGVGISVRNQVVGARSVRFQSTEAELEFNTTPPPN